MVLPLALALVSVPHPVETVPIIPEKGGLTVDASLGGVPGRFFIATAATATYVSPKFLQKLPKSDTGRAEVIVGNTRLGLAVPSEADVAAAYPGVDGIIGAECLQDVALGIDSAGLQLRLWPGGASKGQAEVWIREVVPQAKVGWLPVDVSSGGALVRVKIGGRTGTFAFDTTTAKTEARRSAVPEKGLERITLSESRVLGSDETYPVDVVATNGFTFGDTKPFWSIVRRKRDEEPSAFGADGLVTPRGLLSRRIVLDFKNARLGYDIPDLDEAIGRSLSQLTSLWIRVEGSRLVFIRPLDGSSDQMRRVLTGGELVEYEGIPAAKILAAMREGGEQRLKILAVFANAFDAGIRGKVLLNGKVRALEVAPPG